jgi:hypothetical protein
VQAGAGGSDIIAAGAGIDIPRALRLIGAAVYPPLS